MFQRSVLKMSFRNIFSFRKCLFLSEFFSQSLTEWDSYALFQHSVALGLHHCNTSDLSSFSLALNWHCMIVTQPYKELSGWLHKQNKKQQAHSLQQC